MEKEEEIQQLTGSFGIDVSKERLDAWLIRRAGGRMPGEQKTWC